MNRMVMPQKSNVQSLKSKVQSSGGWIPGFSRRRFTNQGWLGKLMTQRAVGSSDRLKPGLHTRATAILKLSGDCRLIGAKSDPGLNGARRLLCESGREVSHRCAVYGCGPSRS